jgi:hypothetical protein
MTYVDCLPPTGAYNKAPVPQKCLIGPSCCTVWHTAGMFPVVFLENRRQTAAPSYYDSQKIHLGHFTKFLGPRVDRPCSLINQRLLEQYLLERLAVRNPATVKREKTTLTHFYGWVATSFRDANAGAAKGSVCESVE